jgi:hypothetical protein
MAISDTSFEFVQRGWTCILGITFERTKMVNAERDLKLQIDAVFFIPELASNFVFSLGRKIIYKTKMVSA